MSKKMERRVSGTTAKNPEVSKRKEQKEYDPVAGFRISKELKQNIDNLANELKVSNSDLAKLFFEYGLKAYKNGELKFNLEPKNFEISLK